MFDFTNVKAWKEACHPQIWLGYIYSIFDTTLNKIHVFLNPQGKLRFKLPPTTNDKTQSQQANMSTSTLTGILSQLRHNNLSKPQEVSSLLTKAKRQLLNLNALLPSPSTPPQLLSLARQTLETGALLSIRLHEPDAFTRYYQQLLPFYELPESSFEGNSSGQRSKVTGLYLLLLLTKGDYAGFHTVLEGLEVENEGKGGLQGNEYIQYPIKLERWLMEGSYDRVWRATKREGVPSEEYGVFSEVSTVTGILRQIDTAMSACSRVSLISVFCRSSLGRSARRLHRVQKKHIHHYRWRARRTYYFSIAKAAWWSSHKEGDGL